MKVGLIQYDATNNVTKNLKLAEKYLNECLSENCDIVCLPEIFLSEGEEKRFFKEDCNEIKFFKNFSKENKIAIVLGSIIIENENGKKSNTCFFINNKGEIIYSYKKIKMYKTFREDFYFDESETTTAGSEVGLLDYNGVKIGLAICYDLRFPEIFIELAKKGAQIIFLPSCFRVSTGFKAWQILPEARAIENQVFFCACSQTGGKGVKLKCGNSRIINYKGETLSKIGRKNGIVIADINFEEQHNYRKILPVLKDI